MDDATKRAIVERARAAGENPILPIVREYILNKSRQPNVGTGPYRDAPENMPTRESVNRPVIPIQNRGSTQFQPTSVTSDDFVDPQDSQALEALKVQNRNLQREGLISPTDALGREVAVSSAQAVTLGRDQAEYNNQKSLLSDAADSISGLLGDFDFKGLLRVLARPEFVAPMGPGQSPITNFINAAAADRTAGAAQRKAAGESALEQFKAETDRLKALQPDPSKMPKLTSEVSKLYDQLSSAQGMADIGDKIRVSLDKSFAVTGGPGVAAEGLRAIAAMFGADIEVEADKVNLRTAELKRMILEGKIFGREANKQELEILSKLVQGPGFTTNKSQILNALDSLTKQAERRSFNITNRLQAFGMPTDFTNKRPSNAGFVRNQ